MDAMDLYEVVEGLVGECKFKRTRLKGRWCVTHNAPSFPREYGIIFGNHCYEYWPLMASTNETIIKVWADGVNTGMNPQGLK